MMDVCRLQTIGGTGGRGPAIAGMLVVVALIPGCPGSGVPGSQNPGPVTKEGTDANDAFPLAVQVAFDENGAARLEGQVSRVGDLDVFSVGAVLRGDRIVVDAGTPGSPLDVSIALFDGEGRLVSENDDRGGALETFLDSFIDFVVRHDGEPYYVVVTHSAFAASNRLLGGYVVDVSITAGSVLPEPRPQTLLLNFDGGPVDSPVLGTFQLEPFEAGDIDEAFDGQTQFMKDEIHNVFLQNYERFNVTIVTSDDPPPPAPFTTIHLGGFNRNAFGLAENVDLYNIDLCDDAIVYTESFGPEVFLGSPSAAQVAAAIGNVGSHEAGHLLGLNHTDDDSDLMDDRSLADVLFLDQEFKEAPLSADIMPIGTQDGVLLLAEIVGLVEGAVVTADRPTATVPTEAATWKQPEGSDIGKHVMERSLTRERLKDQRGATRGRTPQR